ncbi:MAG: DUF3810 domain-containing protein [Lachnospiraceae bacterium]|nr:DUF3810 domain-containing protein [Lachnospiraceae bacterium]
MKKRGIKVLAVVLVTVLLNVIAWHSTAFCDFYVRYIFPIWVNTYGRVSGIWSFSVGELMIAVGLALTAFAALLGIAAVIFRLLVKDAGLGEKMRRLCRSFYRFFGYTCVAVMVVMTLNCFILYHCSTFDVKYLTGNKEEYTIEELTLLRDYVVTQANMLSEQMVRDENGNIIYEGDMAQTAIESMQALGEEYEQLAGYYPKPKEIYTSEFLSQQKMAGYYFPFSMEANYNGVMHITNKPATMCHELAHLKGFIYEDEANLIGYLACINSDDPMFRYSGYLSVLKYIDNDFKKSIHKNSEIYNSHVKISAQVKKDNVFLTEESWAKVEHKAVVKTETVAKASNTFVQTNLVMNGVEDGKLSYCRVVDLLMNYYATNVDAMEPDVMEEMATEKE